MTGRIIDTVRYRLKSTPKPRRNGMFMFHTICGIIRVFDTMENKPVIISAPDGPNVIEHHNELIEELSRNFRVICFEFPGVGFSRPNTKYDYSIGTGAKLIINLMNMLRIEHAVLAFSCSNGFYAIKSAEMFPDRIVQVILSQTPSLDAMQEWSKATIPNILKTPFVGQLVNAFSEKKLVSSWYKYALPRATDLTNYCSKAIHALNSGGCFCLSSLVQGLIKDSETRLNLSGVPTTLVWGGNDYTHKHTSKEAIFNHVPNCEIIEFDNCGHFPELERPIEYSKLIFERVA